MATTRAQQVQIEQGERFMRQLAEMFDQTRKDMSAQFIPRNEGEARFDHLEDAISRAVSAVEKLTGNVSSMQESALRTYELRENAVREYSEMHTAIGKLEVSVDAVKDRLYGSRVEDLQRTYGARFEDIQGRYKGDAEVERGWRRQAHDQSTQLLTWLVGGGAVLLTIAANVILTLALRH